MGKKKVSKSYSIWKIAHDGGMSDIVADLEKHGLSSPDDIDDIQWSADGTKIKYVFYIEVENDQED